MPKPSARELLNLSEGYRVRRCRKGEPDVAWADTGREPDRRCPRSGLITMFFRTIGEP